MFDFTEWFLEDPDGSLTVNKNRVSWVKADRSTVRCVGRNIEIIDDFHHQFIVCIQDGYVEDELNVGLIRLWELRRDWESRIWIYARKTSDGWTIHFEQRHRGCDLWAIHGEERFEWGRRYRIKLDRKGDQYRLRMIDEETDAPLTDFKELRGINQPFQQIWIASTIKSRRNRGNWSTGYIEKLVMSQNVRI
jgi:hypothetical protein